MNDVDALADALEQLANLFTVIKKLLKFAYVWIRRLVEKSFLITIGIRGIGRIGYPPAVMAEGFNFVAMK